MKAFWRRGRGASSRDDAQTPAQLANGTAMSQEVVETSEEILVTIPGAMVHLVDEQQSVLLASGDFSLVRLVQNGDGIAVFAKVGGDFQWPVAKDEATAKLDTSHYFFTLRVVDGDGIIASNPSSAERSMQRSASTINNAQSAETMSYGVTFDVEGNEKTLMDLDMLLGQYSSFSAPKVVQGGNKDHALVATNDAIDNFSPPAGKNMPAVSSTDDLTTAAYWTTLAPNVQEYNSSLAKAIATGSGQVIRGIIRCSDSTISKLQKGETYMKGRIKPGSKQAEFTPRTMKNIRRARKVSKMSQKTAKAVLSGVVTTAGMISSSVIQSKPGKKFFKLLPGEVALASLDAFGRIFDALDVAGKNVLSASSEATSGVVSHRYGEQAAELTKDGLATFGHAAGTMWTLSKIRKAFNPKNATSTSTTLMKSAAKGAYIGAKER
ncbi:hypothetical protein O6H91_06G101500 [Diphasiastrum complanatum]|uniref:Uncharacterized protein n=1 Tax=Diphasiastrum complanatum TaxID=34168 RepID=A0ACC2DHR8_DIPCM|nr:hypothetical protein O6H91_06G101500 [Diphasiastrum complanatum]